MALELRGRAVRAEQGFSLVEVMVASLILLVLILGVLPLFTRSMINNQAGNDYTKLSNHGKSRVEEFFQLRFDDPRLTIAGGGTEATFDDYWSISSEKWLPGPAPAGDSEWNRTVTVRQFNLGTSIDKDTTTVDFQATAALDGGADAISVHLKEILVEVERAEGGPLGPQRRIVLRTLKSK